MNTNKLKKFAQEARRKLLQQVGAKLEYVLTHDTAELREKAPQIQKLKEELNHIGKDQLIEKVAYTWFNRLMALRFMDANGYQPSGIRIVSPKDGYTLPQILDEAKQGHFPEEISVGKQKVLDILDGRIPSRNPQNEAFRYLLIGACNALHQQFSFLFERINDYTELLLPDDLTSEFSIVHDLVEGMRSADCQEVEVIGWLYQFYISEKKDEVFAAKSKVKKEDIPAATQLFTPRWIVEYMIQNTLGKLWLQNRPSSQLRDHMPYFIESPSLVSDDYLKIDSVEEIRLLDQACGSGHILVYAFELLTKIYEEEGYDSRDIPKLIIEKNLYGFEIDERAAQLAGLSLLMKARAYYRRLFRKQIQPSILCFKDIKFAEGELEQYFEKTQVDIFHQELKHDIQLFEQATNLGSLIQLHSKNIPKVRASLLPTDIFLAKTHEKIQVVLWQMNLLKQKFHCVVDNPPYMGGGKMNNTLSDYVKKNYPNSKSDLMAAFMEAGLATLHSKGFLGMINQQSWMFLSSYEQLRKKIIEEVLIDTLVQIGYNSFPELNSKVVQATTFVFQKYSGLTSGVYVNLNDAPQSADKQEVFNIKLKEKNIYTVNQKDFEKIPGSPIGYWLEEDVYKIFKISQPLEKLYNARKGLTTSLDARFLRKWFEVSLNKTSLKCSLDDKEFGNRRFFPINKGGGYRKWYGNFLDICNWENDGEELKEFKGSYIRGNDFYFKRGITWNAVSTLSFSCRYVPSGFLFNDVGPTIYSSPNPERLIAYLNSSHADLIFRVLCPTMKFEVGQIQIFPVPDIDSFDSSFDKMSEECIAIYKKEWDDKETSWDFNKSNVLLHKMDDELENAINSIERFVINERKKDLRLENNINLYLSEKLDLSIRQIDYSTIILYDELLAPEGVDVNEVLSQFISYSVGCMMGRYSLEKEGLVLANQGDTLNEFARKVDKELSEVRFLPDDDAILPILDDEWFEDDVVGRFYEFLKVAFGEQEFQKNLDFMQEKLGKDIRKYFVRDFYKDHIKRYKKRPIYWLFSSPQGSFNVLVYLHRYTPDTINNILNNYLREFIQKLKSQKAHFEQIQISSSTTEQNKATKAIDKLDKMILDCEEYERDILYPLATERIAIDLDDGVLVNYNKMGKAVKEVKGLNDKKAKDKVRKFDWIDTSQII